MPKSSKPPDQDAPFPALPAEDLALWQEVARGIAPLRRSARPAAFPAPAGTPARGSPPGPRAAPPPPEPAPKGRTGVSAAPPPLAEPGRRHVRRLRKGHIPIDRRLDLHGMGEAAAHWVLRTFLAAAAAEGARWVLVITGKGQRARSLYGNATGTFMDRREPGVLRRSVPRWLAEPGLRDIVAGYGEASAAHGGEGALYVRLRRPRRSR